MGKLWVKPTLSPASQPTVGKSGLPSTSIPEAPQTHNAHQTLLRLCEKIASNQKKRSSYERFFIDLGVDLISVLLNSIATTSIQKEEMKEQTRMN